MINWFFRERLGEYYITFNSQQFFQISIELLIEDDQVEFIISDKFETKATLIRESVDGNDIEFFEYNFESLPAHIP